MLLKHLFEKEGFRDFEVNLACARQSTNLSKLRPALTAEYEKKT